jgi:hypothetical protein
MLMQAMSISCKILGLGVFGGLYLFQSSSIPQASAIAQKASEASKKTLNLPFSILQWGACFTLFFGVVDARGVRVSLRFFVNLGPNFSTTLCPSFGWNFSPFFGNFFGFVWPFVYGLFVLRLSFVYRSPRFVCDATLIPA